MIRGVGEGIGRSEKELFQRGGIGFTPLHCDGVNPSKRLRDANLEVVRDVYNSIHYAALTLQRDHVHVIELPQAASTNVTKRRQVDHGECVGEAITLLSREQGGFLMISSQSIFMESEVGESREI